MNVFIARLAPDVLFPERPADRCRRKYLCTINLLVDRYLQLADKRTERARRDYTDPAKYEKLREKTRLSRGTSEITPRRTKYIMEVRAAKYSVDLSKYHIGTFTYMDSNLEMYKNVPDELKHYSLTCFYSDVKSSDNYYFKNIDYIIPTSDFTDKFIIDFDVFKIN